MVILSYRPRATWVRNGNPPTPTVGSLGEVMSRATSSFLAWEAMVRSAAYAAIRSAATNSPPSTTTRISRTIQIFRPRLAAIAIPSRLRLRPSEAGDQQHHAQDVRRWRGEREPAQRTLHVPC